MQERDIPPFLVLISQYYDDSQGCTLQEGLTLESKVFDAQDIQFSGKEVVLRHHFVLDLYCSKRIFNYT